MFGKIDRVFPVAAPSRYGQEKRRDQRGREVVNPRTLKKRQPCAADRELFDGLVVGGNKTVGGLLDVSC